MSASATQGGHNQRYFRRNPYLKLRTLPFSPDFRLSNTCDGRKLMQLQSVDAMARVMETATAEWHGVTGSPSCVQIGEMGR